MANFTSEQEEQIKLLRKVGIGYRKIATELGLDRDAVRYYCKQNELAGKAKPPEERLRGIECLQCGERLPLRTTGKMRLFCTSKCRYRWWKENGDRMERPMGKREEKLCAHFPKKHEKYDLLPLCRKSGGEEFDYPGKMINDVETLISSQRGLLPYNHDSYEEYYGYLDKLIEGYAVYPDTVDALVRLKQRVLDMNQKEEWSVVRYGGPSDDGRLGLTHGKNYYWPTRKSNPVYCGVVDDEEFTAYLYPTDAHLWEILEEPTGMAYRTIYANGKGSITTEAYDAMMAQFGCVFSDTQE